MPRTPRESPLILRGSILRGSILRTVGLIGLAGLVAVGVSVGPASSALQATAATTKATAQAARGLPYVALGDSYAAGYGLPDPTGEPAAGCAQSARNYPHRVAARLGLRLTDVSCSAATTANVVDTPQHGAPAQVDALGPKTKIVTVSIGGNDANLFGTASSCIALARTGPVFDATASTRSCKEKLDPSGDDTLRRAIDTTTAAGLRSAFRAIRAQAPAARVFVVGYPAIFPDAEHTPTAGCFRPVVDSASLAEGLPRNGFPFTDTDVAYLAGVQAHFDSVLKKAASTAGFTYVDTLDDSEAHSACATTQSYIQGVSLVASPGFRDITLRPGALHPTDLGTAYLADRAAEAITTSLAATPGASPSTSGGSAPRAGVGAVVAGGVAVLLAAASVVLITRSRRRRRDDSRP